MNATSNPRSNSQNDSAAVTSQSSHRKTANDIQVTTLSSTPLSAGALQTRNADASALSQYWQAEEEKRVERLVKASRELGFELPRRCY
ncbi:hypothetical protein P280DRAFT_474368 [Massarina eburnea CBS 473.64]|uniref:Uncharacterized protein n=1 Tax=Massarina eburnea CBS 473.64 TaxID=1395130 RepID=A0A6A6RL79_9PLEO|nr:hypothetical protein P280DRAFT_474368 [Massarina eburnea CBS 473.64]